MRTALDINSTASTENSTENSTASRQLDRPAHGVSLDRLDRTSTGSTGKASTTGSTAPRRSLDSSTARQPGLKCAPGRSRRPVEADESPRRPDGSQFKSQYAAGPQGRPRARVVVELEVTTTCWSVGVGVRGRISRAASSLPPAPKSKNTNASGHAMGASSGPPSRRPGRARGADRPGQLELQLSKDKVNRSNLYTGPDGENRRQSANGNAHWGRRRHAHA